MKIILLGDSHLAGLKLAIPVKEGREFVFAAYPSHVHVNMGMFAAKGQSLVPISNDLKGYLESTLGESEINLYGADVVVLTGLRTEFPYKLLEDSSISSHVVSQSMTDILTTQSLSFSLATKIRKINQTVPIVVIPNPLITEHLKSETIITAPGILPVTHFGKLGSFSIEPLLRWKSALEVTFAQFGAYLCFQNNDTIVDGVYTRRCFAHNPLDVPPGIRHMNVDFWKSVYSNLELILAKV